MLTNSATYIFPLPDVLFFPEGQTDIVDHREPPANLRKCASFPRLKDDWNNASNLRLTIRWTMLAPLDLSATCTGLNTTIPPLAHMAQVRGY